MKIYEFPFGGSTGKGDTWDSSIEFELTDEEAVRLEESARKEPRCRLDEDETISDICRKIEKYIFEENKRRMIEDGSLDEAREDWKYFNGYDEEDDDEDVEYEDEEYEDEDEDEEYEDDDIPSDDELVEEEMGIWHVLYPESLQNLESEENS